MTLAPRSLLAVLVLVLAVAAACSGPSSGELTTARAAVHDREAGAALDAIAETIKADYPGQVAIDVAARVASAGK
jgi:ABC-type glycerol-3-phosphate transport system substrate-binding protein